MEREGDLYAFFKSGVDDAPSAHSRKLREERDRVMADALDDTDPKVIATMRLAEIIRDNTVVGRPYAPGRDYRGIEH